MAMFRIYLVGVFACLTGYTLVVGGDHGWNLLPIFFSNIAEMTWSGQFNLDFMTFLGLSGIWVAWRHQFTGRAIALGLVAFFGGMSVIVELAARLQIDDIAGREMRPLLDHAGAAEHFGHRILAGVGERRGVPLAEIVDGRPARVDLGGEGAQLSLEQLRFLRQVRRLAERRAVPRVALRDVGLGDGVDEKMYEHEVGLKQPNPFGLFDMHGNVGEWCFDPLKPPTFVVRGGAFVAAAIAGTTYMKVAVEQVKPAIVGFIMPLTFIWAPVVLLKPKFLRRVHLMHR